MAECFHRVVIGLGSNLDHGAPAKITLAINKLAAMATVLAHSGIYTSVPLNKESDKIYHNAVISAVTCGTMPDFIAYTKSVEKELGRERNKTDEVVIDIDVVMWDEEVLRPHEMERDYFIEGFKKINADTTA